MGPARRKAHGGRCGRSLKVLAVALGALTMAAAGLASGALAAEPPARSPGGKIPLIYQKKRSFRIPFHIDAEGRARLKEIQLWVSEDSGFHWEPKSKTTPDLGKFTFRTSHDGEFWFATRTLTVEDAYSPPMNQTVEPSMKVVVDTIPPSILLDPDGRRGSLASVRWEVKDEHLDLKTLLLEYQVEGAKEWRRVPIRRPSLLGTQRWDAGTADSLRVRASVADKAGNVADAEIVMPEGTAGDPDFAAADAETSAPPVEQISNSASAIAEGPGFPPVQEGHVQGSGSTARSGARRSLAGRTRDAESPATGADPSASDWDRGGGGGTAVGSARAVSASGSGPLAAAAPSFSNPFPMNDKAGAAALPGAADAFPSTGPGTNAGPGGVTAAGNRSMLVPSPRFKLQYAIDDAGPDGPAVVELWMTQDGGRNWIRRAEDTDRVSPFEVDLGGEGTFGLSLVARSASGLGDQPPAPGDPPQTWVEVDTTPPSVQLYPPQIGTGPHAGKVAITWRASDLHLAPRSVSLFWRPDQAGSTWQPIIDGQENMGQYIWTVPPSFPAKFHIRVEAVDTVGHRGGAETADSAPVIVDRSRPRSRIIGLDPNARAGVGPGARPLR
ncbi:MAG: hypothetical protein ACXWO1_07200 [Isosphaeraceae bacterium]